MRSLTVAFLALLMGSAVGSAETTASCSRDLAAVDRSFEATLANLDASRGDSQAALCAAWRQHVAIMRKGVATFERCMTGHARRENTLQLLVSIDDFRTLIRRKCA